MKILNSKTISPDKSKSKVKVIINPQNQILKIKVILQLKIIQKKL